MPFDFSEFKHYSINYLELYNEINSKVILNDKNIQSAYLKAWIMVLQNCDMASTQQLATKEDISKARLLLLSEPERFQFPISFTNTKVFIHFRISILNKILSNHKDEFIVLPTEDFVGENSTIKWNPVDANVDTYIEATDPIITVCFLSGRYSSLVIDGNHRLTYKVKHNIKDVHVLNVSEEAIVENNVFSSGFDKYYYIMNNELAYMIDATHSKDKDARELIKLSYLTDGKLKLSQAQYLNRIQ